MTIENISFETQWNDTTIGLATPEETTANKVKQVAFNVFSVLFPPLGVLRLMNYGVSAFANRLSLPAAHYISKTHIEEATKRFEEFWEGPITEKNMGLREHYHLVRQTVITPDKVALQAICLQHKDSSPEMPTLMYFNGNFQLSVETPTWILTKSLELNSPCNLVLFDYRGVGKSTGRFTKAKDLIIDGSSIVEWVKEKIKTNPANIHFYGFSLGGAIASLTKALDPKNLTGRLINDRSFSSSEKIIMARYGTGYFGRFLNWLFIQNGYCADPASAFKKASGEKLVIYHPNDRIIPTDASMQFAVQHDLNIKLEPKPGFEDRSNERHHVAPLHWHETAVERVLEFLFPFASTFSEDVS
jgi:pimeloyl-ACP methyl ester carboxylesterase